MTRDHLIGWLCFTRYQLSRGKPVHMPSDIAFKLVRAKWIDAEREPDTDGLHFCGITEKGHTVSDLAAPEWGIDPIGATK